MLGRCFTKGLRLARSACSTASFKKFRAWICSNLVEKRSERPVVVLIIRVILVRTQRLSNFAVDVGPQGRSPETLRSKHRRQKGVWSSTISLGMNLWKQSHSKPYTFCQHDGDRWALFVTGVCSASAVAVSPELRALVAVTAGALFLKNKCTHFKVR